MEPSAPEEIWAEQVELWSNEGFHVDSIIKKLSDETLDKSTTFLEAENQIKEAKSLQKELNKLTSMKEKEDWMEKTRSFENIDATVIEWKDWCRLNRPWKYTADLYVNEWKNVGQEKILDQFIEKMDSFDDSTKRNLNALLPLLEHPQNIDDLQAMITDLELSEEKKKAMIHSMVEEMRGLGYDVSQFATADIEQSFVLLENIERLHEQRQRVQQLIKLHILPFDTSLAERLIEDNESSMEQVMAMGESFSNRLREMNERILSWQKKGISLHPAEKIYPHELLDWEAEIPEIEIMAQAQYEALTQWEHFKKIWPEKANTIQPDLDDLQQSEKLIQAVESMELWHKSKELDFLDLVEKWKSKGFIMGYWLEQSKENLQDALTNLTMKDEEYSFACTIIDQWHSLDFSVSINHEFVEIENVILQSIPDRKLLLEIQKKLEIHAKRTIRHRKLLEAEWRTLKTKFGMAETDTHRFDLAEFEAFISQNQILMNQNSGIDRLSLRILKLIEEWSLQGFNTDGLQKMAKFDDAELRAQFPGIKSQVQHHHLLRKRLSVLPWNRSEKLFEEVNDELQRPERLSYIELNLKNYALELSKLPENDVEESRDLWKPKPILSQNTPLSSRVSTPQDDAMEAILEAMETEEIEPVPTPNENRLKEKEVAITPDKESKVNNKHPVNNKHRRDSVEDIPMKTKSKPFKQPLKEENVKSKSAPSQVDKSVSESPTVDDTSVNLFLQEIGLDEKDLKSNNVKRSVSVHIGASPRDMRIDRMLRLFLRILDIDDEQVKERLIHNLIKSSNAIKVWTKNRLSARHQPTSGNLLQDAKILGEVLHRIPGPGLVVPLEKDVQDLPSAKHLDELENAVQSFASMAQIPSTGGISAST